MRFGIASCALLAIAAPVFAGDEVFRCGSSIISTELSVAELLAKCGEPSSRQVSTEDVRARVAGGGTQKVGTTTVEKWRYERSRAVPMVVIIVDGKIQSIDRGE